MEWTELQTMWQQYDTRLAENTRINKEILKQMLRAKPERRMNRNRIQEWYGLIVPIAVLGIVLPNAVRFRDEPDFYIGIVLCIIYLALTYNWSIRHYLLFCKIDLTDSVIDTKKKLKKMENYEIKGRKLGFLRAIFLLASLILLAELPFLTGKFILFTLLLILLMVFTVYVHALIRSSWYKNLNAELDEIENLEKE